MSIYVHTVPYLYVPIDGGLRKVYSAFQFCQLLYTYVYIVDINELTGFCELHFHFLLTFRNFTPIHTLASWLHREKKFPPSLPWRIIKRLLGHHASQPSPPQLDPPGSFRFPAGFCSMSLAAITQTPEREGEKVLWVP